MTARAAATVYAALLGHVDAVHLVSAGRRAAMAAMTYQGLDTVMGTESAWAFGYTPASPAGMYPGSVFGMLGGNGSAAFADIGSGTAVAVMRNRIGDFTTAARIDHLVIGALGQEGKQQMSEPAASLDTRFSAPGSAATPWETTLQVLRAAELSWITTVRHDGRPHVSPLVTVWFDGALWFSTGATEQKAVNLRTSRQVVVTTGCDSWDHGLDVVVEGEASRETNDGVLAQLAEAWTAKWDGRWHYEARDGAFHHPGGGETLVFRLVPRKVLAFGKGAFTHTSYRFAAPTASTRT